MWKRLYSILCRTERSTAMRSGALSRAKALYKPNEQSVYSALHRMEGCGYIKGNWGDERMGATRKYYEMTEEGKAMLENKRTEWEAAKMVIDALLSRD